MKQRLTVVAAVLGFFVALIAVLDFVRRRMARMDAESLGSGAGPAGDPAPPRLTVVNGDRA